MINGSSIRRNAIEKAEEFFEVNTAPTFQLLFNDGKISQTQFDEMSKSSLRGALKSMNVRFKNGNLDHMASQNPKFKELQRLLSKQNQRSFDEKMTLEFLNDCFMIGSAFEFASFRNAKISQKASSFARNIEMLVFSILCDLVEEVEELYLIDMSEKSRHKALVLLLSDAEHSLNDSHIGNLPLETAMQVS